MIYIFYTNNYDINSGGNSLNFMLCDYLYNNLNLNNFYIAPYFCRGDGLIDKEYIRVNNLNENDFIFDIHGRSIFLIENLKDSYFNKDNYNFPEKYKKFLVTKEILLKKDNVAIYSEAITGNPLQQKFVWRWILYFPSPGLPVDPYFPWGKNDKFVYWAKSYYKNKDLFYRNINTCKLYKSNHYPNEEDILYLKYLFIHDKVDLNYSNKNLNRSGSCHLIRKADINYNRTFGNNWNDNTFYNKNYPFMKPKSPIYIHPDDSVCIDSYELNDLINIFQQKEYLYCYDLYTFHNCLALLYGCKVIMCPPEGNLTKEEWHCGDKCYLDYMAWGNSKEELEKAEIALKDVNYGEILKECQNNFLDDFIDVYNELEIYYCNIHNKIYTETVEYYLCFGNNFKTLEYKDISYSKLYSANFWEIEVEFIVFLHNIDYANIFDMNFNRVNCGPRLELNNNNLSLIIGNEQILHGYDLDNNIELNKLYNLKLILESNKLTISLNNNITVHNLYITPNYFDNIVIGKGFSEERYFKGLIKLFKVTIY
jgi:hypothetical protein